MASRLWFSDAAERDLEDIYLRGLRSGSPERARAYVNDLRRRCGLFLDQPGSGRALPEIDPPVRLFSFDKLVTVAFQANGEDVEILRLMPRGAALTQLRKPYP